jgi:5-methylcytosine-specific restriction endonuclease McrA
MARGRNRRCKFCGKGASKRGKLYCRGCALKLGGNKTRPAEEWLTTPPKKKRPNYDEYMRSEAWSRKRTQAIEHAKGRCQTCGETQGLEVHHLTYTRLGREKMEDLQVLCGGCHSLEHENKYRARDELSKEFREMFAA